MPGQQAATNSVMQQANQNHLNDQNYTTDDNRVQLHNSNGFNNMHSISMQGQVPNIGGTVNANEYHEYGSGHGNNSPNLSNI